MKSIAILLDGGFVRNRLYVLLGRRHATADDIVRLSTSICLPGEDLFRIYYYDCPPVDKVRQNPLLKTSVNFGDTPTAQRNKSLQDALAHKDHVAFRRGKLVFRGWGFNTRVLAELMRCTTTVLSADRKCFDIRISLDLDRLANDRILDPSRLPSDNAKAKQFIVNHIFKPEIEQKCVDIKIGLDVAWLASRHIVDRIVLVTADTDFIPAMKFARREGVQVVLVPLDHPGLSPELSEHADEIRRIPPATLIREDPPS